MLVASPALLGCIQDANGKLYSVVKQCPVERQKAPSYHQYQ